MNDLSQKKLSLSPIVDKDKVITQGSLVDMKQKHMSIRNDLVSQKLLLPFQLPRVIEGGVWINDSREFELHPVWHWQPVGGGVHTRVKWCEPHFALL